MHALVIFNEGFRHVWVRLQVFSIWWTTRFYSPVGTLTIVIIHCEINLDYVFACLIKGFAVHPYNDQFVEIRRTSTKLLKGLGYSRKYGESRISIELENLVEKLRKLDGRPIDVNDMLYQCANGIMMSFMFGRHFDYDNDPLMQEVCRTIELARIIYDPLLILFPILSYLPKYRRVFDALAASRE